MLGSKDFLNRHMAGIRARPLLTTGHAPLLFQGIQSLTVPADPLLHIGIDYVSRMLCPVNREPGRMLRRITGTKTITTEIVYRSTGLNQVIEEALELFSHASVDGNLLAIIKRNGLLLAGHWRPTRYIECTAIASRTSFNITWLTTNSPGNTPSRWCIGSVATGCLGTATSATTIGTGDAARPAQVLRRLARVTDRVERRPHAWLDTATL